MDTLNILETLLKETKTAIESDLAKLAWNGSVYALMTRGSRSASWRCVNEYEDFGIALRAYQRRIAGKGGGYEPRGFEKSLAVA